MYKVGHLDYKGYFYRANPNSLTSSSTDIKNDIYGILSLIDCNERLKAEGLTIGKNPISKNIFALSKYPKSELNEYKEELSEILIWLVHNFSINK